MNEESIGKVMRIELGRFIDEALDPYLKRTFATKEDMHVMENNLRNDLASKRDLQQMEKNLREDLASQAQLETVKSQLSNEISELRGDLGLTKMKIGKKLGVSFSAS